jgi:hypothetical protein
MTQRHKKLKGLLKEMEEVNWRLTKEGFELHDYGMDILKHYLNRANEIIGERTAEEAKYDREVIRWLRKGKDIKKSIAKANEKYPTEALQLDDNNLADVQSHYEYQAEHEAIVEKLNALNI